MQSDLVTLLIVGGLAYAAIALYRRFRDGSGTEEDARSVNQRKDVLRALKSMRKD